MNLDANEFRNKPLLTVKDLQIILGLGRTNTYAFINNRPPFRILRVNNSIRIPSKDVFDWIDGNKG